jgi:hypothetical protein
VTGAEHIAKCEQHMAKAEQWDQPGYKDQMPAAERERYRGNEYTAAVAHALAALALWTNKNQQDD